MSAPSDSGVKAPNTANLVTVSNVAEIFNAAGFAFKKLGELVQQLDQGPADGAATTNGDASAPAANGLSHWEANDVEQFQSIITNFNDEMSKLSNNLKNKMSKRLQDEHTQQAMNRIATTTTTAESGDAIKTE